jgi:GTP-binding protein
MLSMLSESLVTTRGVQPFTLQAIITKADTVPIDQLEPVIVKMRKDIWAAAPLCLPPIVTSAELSPPFGVDLVRHNITKACSL